MKKILLGVCMMCLAVQAYAAMDMATKDTVILNTGREIKGLVIEVAGEYIRMIVDKEIVKLRFRNMSIDSSSYYRFYHVPDYDPQLIYDLTKPDPVPPPPKTYKDFARDGIALAEEGKYQEAVEAFSTAIDMKDDVPDFYLFRAGAYQELGKTNDAITDYSRVLKQNPENVVVYCRRGWAYQSLGWNDRALADYSRVLELDPNNFEILRERYGLYNAAEDWEAALKDLERILALSPEEGEAYQDRAVLTYRLGDYYETWSSIHDALKRGVSVPPKFIEAVAKKMPDPFATQEYKRNWMKEWMEQIKAAAVNLAGFAGKYAVFLVAAVLCAVFGALLFFTPSQKKERVVLEDESELEEERVEKLLRPVSFKKAGLLKRICAGLIDLILISVVSWALTIMAGMDIFSAVFGGLILLRDSFGGFSIGKTVAGLRVVDEHGYPCGFLQCFLRNFTFGLPVILFYVVIWCADLRVDTTVRLTLLGVFGFFLVEGIAILLSRNTGRRLGDRLAGTYVHDLHPEYRLWPFYVSSLILFLGFFVGNIVTGMVFNKAFVYKMNPMRYYNIDYDFSFKIPPGWETATEGEGGIVLRNEAYEGSMVLLINNEVKDYPLDVCVSAFTKAMEEDDMVLQREEELRVSGRPAFKKGLMKKEEDSAVMLIYFKKEAKGPLYIFQATTVKNSMRDVMQAAIDAVSTFRFE